MNISAFSKFAKKKKKGEIIFCEFEPGSTIFFIKSGTVKVTKILGGREKALAVLRPGDIFGEMAILEKQSRSATAIAEEDTELFEFSNDSFSQLVDAQPAIAIKLLKTLAERIKDQTRKFCIIYLPDNESKIMDVFLMLAEKQGINLEKSIGENISFDIDIAGIANWAGLSEADTKIILTDMENQNRIKLEDKSIIVTNLYQFFRHVLSKRSAMERESES